MTLVLGIDPGSRITGYGIVSIKLKQISYVSSGTITLSKEPLSERLYKIYAGIEKIVSMYNIDEVAVESVFMHVNPGSALKLGHARGAAIVGAYSGCSNIFEYTARQVKQTVVGYGAADKTQVSHMVKHILKLKGKIQVDSSDALAVALCHVQSKAGMDKLKVANSYKKEKL